MTHQQELRIQSTWGLYRRKDLSELFYSTNAWELQVFEDKFTWFFASQEIHKVLMHLDPNRTVKELFLNSLKQHLNFFQAFLFMMDKKRPLKCSYSSLIWWYMKPQFWQVIKSPTNSFLTWSLHTNRHRELLKTE